MSKIQKKQHANEKHLTDSLMRFPVHTVYGGADRFRSNTTEKFGQIAGETLKTYAANPDVFAEIFGLSPDLAADIYRKTAEKLRTEPIEDFRIDFEDGFGYRTEREEDEAAVNAARELSQALKLRQLSPFCGIRVRPFASDTIDRAKRTIDLFVKTLIDKGNALPGHFVITLPKIRSFAEVRSLTGYLSNIEKRFRLKEGAIGIELMAETPETIFDRDGKVAIGKFITATRGRCRSVHFGAYDYTSLLGISAADQDIRHPACIFARNLLQAALAASSIRLVDSVTIQMPIPIHRSERLNKKQKQENVSAIHSAWRRHFNNVKQSMREGFFQSWDLHPNQLPARYAAVYDYFLGNAGEQSARLRSFLFAAATASVTNNVFDDAASAEGTLNFFRIGISCGAFSPSEINHMLGCEAADLFLDFPRLVTRIKV